MSAADPNPPQTPKVIHVSATEMTGDWPKEVEKKLIDQGIDPLVAAEMADVARTEVPKFASKGNANPPLSFWRRVLSFFGLTKGGA